MFKRSRPLGFASFALPAFVVLGACGQTAPEPDPETQALALIDAHVAAIGGEGAYAALDNMRSVVEIVEQGATLRGDYRATRDGRMRVDVYFEDERFFSEGIDADGVWQQSGEGAPVEAVDGVAAARLRRGIEQRFRSLAEAARKGGTVRLVEPQERDGSHYDAVEVTTNDDHVRTYLFDRETGIATRMLEREALHPDADMTENDEEDIYSYFADQCGILKPLRTVTINRNTGEELQSSRLVSTDCNIAEEALEIGRPDAD